MDCGHCECLEKTYISHITKVQILQQDGCKLKPRFHEINLLTATRFESMTFQPMSSDFESWQHLNTSLEATVTCKWQALFFPFLVRLDHIGKAHVPVMCNNVWWVRILE